MIASLVDDRGGGWLLMLLHHLLHTAVAAVVTAIGRWWESPVLATRCQPAHERRRWCWFELIPFTAHHTSSLSNNISAHHATHWSIIDSNTVSLYTLHGILQFAIKFHWALHAVHFSLPIYYMWMYTMVHIKHQHSLYTLVHFR